MPGKGLAKRARSNSAVFDSPAETTEGHQSQSKKRERSRLRDAGSWLERSHRRDTAINYRCVASGEKSRVGTDDEYVPRVPWLYRRRGWSTVERESNHIPGVHIAVRGLWSRIAIDEKPAWKR